MHGIIVASYEHELRFKKIALKIGSSEKAKGFNVCIPLHALASLLLDVVILG